MENSLRRLPLSELSGKQFDVIVVGGGITGAGVAQDAASRGLSVLLLEKGDFASGTSSKSTKLIHGGLRYLENLQFGVVYESVTERIVQERIAPHMVHWLPFVIPAYRQNFLSNLKWEAGLWVYDSMAGLLGKRFHKRIKLDEIAKLCPGIRAEGLRGGLLYYDCRTDDARHTLDVIRSAAQFGCITRNYTKVVSFVRDRGDVRGVEVVDALTGEGSVKIHGKVVVNCTGVWSQKTQELSGKANVAVAPAKGALFVSPAKGALFVSPAKGVHFTIKRERLPLECALLVPTGDGRFCFAFPWYDTILIGTTDTPYKGDFDNVTVEDEEEQYILAAVNRQFPNLKLTSADVTGKFAGLRPLISDAKAQGGTTKVSRKHSLKLSEDGLITIAGGKLTTYRPMAAETVDLVAFKLRLDGIEAGPCVTENLMLGGWDGEVRNMEHIKDVFRQMAGRVRISAATADVLLQMYGRRAMEVAEFVSEYPELAEPISAAHPYILAQVVYAVGCESAVTLEDVLARRIRLTITDAEQAKASAEKVSQLMAKLLGWDDSTRQRMVTEFVASVL
ncbi:MAG: glycerol-3-phosphate dehydrogenase/oxidase [Candidatus Melainabacteria bacterium]|nr:glycerol-3-phosphate dehydrogenase/oxidase [Candidatus Melainabacteria bacterium]